VLSIQELSDRIEIQDVIARYSAAIDGHDWDLLDEVFLEDCDCDFTEVTGFQGDRRALKEWLSRGMPTARCYYHMTATSYVVIDTDRAEVVTPCVNPMPDADGGLSIFGHWYRDTFVRTAAGWRIQKRYFEFCYHFTAASADQNPFRAPLQPRSRLASPLDGHPAQ
jgi:SnoaL-like domain